MKEMFIIIASKYRIPFPSKLKEKLIGHFRARQQYKAHQTANILERSSKTFVTFINKLNNAVVAIEGEHVDLPHNIIPPEENAIEQPNYINENKLLKIKETLVNAYAESIVTLFDKRFNLRKPRRKTIKKLEISLEKVSHVIEATPLLTEKIDVTSLNQLAYTAAITAIKTARAENECLIKEETSAGGKEIGHSI